MTKKAYVSGYKSREKLEVGTVDIDFTKSPYDFRTRQEAENACKDLASLCGTAIKIDGTRYPCRDFRVEEWEPGKFAVSCEIAQ